MSKRKRRTHTDIPPQDDEFTWVPVPSAVTLGRLHLLTPDMSALVKQTIEQTAPHVWDRDRGTVEQIGRADTPEALLDLAAQATGLAQTPWLDRVRGYGSRIAPLLAERLKHVRDVSDADHRTHLNEHLIAAFYVCGPDTAALLLDCFPTLDDYGKSLASVILGMLGAQESADTLWEFFQYIQDRPNENYFIGPLWGLVDLGDPRAADALDEIMGIGFYFFEVFAMAHRAGDARLVLPLFYALTRGNERVQESARMALVSIAHRVGRAALLDGLAPIGRDGGVTDANREEMADRILGYDPCWSEDHFASFFQGIDASEIDPADLRAKVEMFEQLDASPSRPASQRLARNDPCWCGSGKKYKHCHMRQEK